MTHKEISEPFTLWLEESILYRDLALKTKTEVEVFGISSYPGSALTFKLLIKSNGAIFDYIPLHLLSKNKNDELKFNLNDLVYHNCPSDNISISTFSYLQKKNFYCWLKHKKIWIKGKFLLNVDWYKDNESANVVCLENGQIGAFPNHKCLVTDSAPLELPQYKAIHNLWIV